MASEFVHVRSTFANGIRMIGLTLFTLIIIPNILISTAITTINNNHENANNHNTFTAEQLQNLLKYPSRLAVNKMISPKHTPILKLNSDLWPIAALNKQEQYDSFHKYPTQNAFNHLISKNKDDIELILSPNDKALTQQFLNGFHSHFSENYKNMQINQQFWSFLEIMKDAISSSSSSSRRRLLNNKNNDDLDHYDYIFDINGASSDLQRINWKTKSTGKSGEYWNINKKCVQLKGCDIYSHFHVLHKSKHSEYNNEFSCEDILNDIMPSIYDCVVQFGANKCPLLLDSGYFRDVFRVQNPRNPGTTLVVKIMKQRDTDQGDGVYNGTDPIDVLRHIRESIMLYYLRNEELDYIDRYGSQFVSNNGEKRAFPYVRELGHCIYPSFISVFPFYNITLEHYIEFGFAKKASIKQLVAMSLDMVRGVELIHNLKGGPFLHTDIEPKQFMIDDYGRVLINDFNRGRFETYLFDHDDDVSKCGRCPNGRSKSSFRSPEEFHGSKLDDKLDVFSISMSIWSLFSGVDPFDDVDFDDFIYLLQTTWRRPDMPVNMPFALQEIIRLGISQNPIKRPSAMQLRKKIENIHKNIEKYARGYAYWTAESVEKAKIFENTDYPEIPNEFKKVKDSNQ